MSDEIMKGLKSEIAKLIDQVTKLQAEIESLKSRVSEVEDILG